MEWMISSSWTTWPSIRLVPHGCGRPPRIEFGQSCWIANIQRREGSDGSLWLIMTSAQIGGKNIICIGTDDLIDPLAAPVVPLPCLHFDVASCCHGTKDRRGLTFC